MSGDASEPGAGDPDDETRPTRDDDETRPTRDDDETRPTRDDDETRLTQGDDETRLTQGDDETRLTQGDDPTVPAPGGHGDAPTGVRRHVHYHQTAAFFAAALALSWAGWGAAYLATGGDLSQAHLIPGAFGPMVAAALVTWMGGGDLRAWARSIADWRVPGRWYLLALGLPAVLTVGGATAALTAAGAPTDLSVLADRLPTYPVALLFIVLLGGGQEEPGWRGFALPRLQERYSALTASLAIGVVWAVWHLPLFHVGLARNATGSFALYAVMVLGLSVLLTWCYNGTGGSVLLAMLFHASVNAAAGLVPAAGDAVSEWALAVDAGMAAAVWLAAAAVIALRDPASLSGRTRQDIREFAGDPDRRIVQD